MKIRLIAAVTMTWLSFVLGRGVLSYADDEIAAVIKEAEMSYAAALSSAKVAYLAELKMLMDAETKKGNLDNAVALRDKIRKIESEGDGAQSVLKSLAGTNWVNTNGVAFQWDDGGKFFHSGKERTCIPIDSHRIAVLWSNVHIDILQFDDKFTKFDQFSSRGNEKPLFVGKRTKLR